MTSDSKSNAAEGSNENPRATEDSQTVRLDPDPAAADRVTDPLLASIAGNPLRLENARTVGVLVVHFVTRDVHLGVDGDTAMRIFQVWQGAAQPDPPVDPNTSPASVPLVGIDIACVYGLTWHPEVAPSDIGERNEA